MLKKKSLICIFISILIIISGVIFYIVRINDKKHYVTINSKINKIYTYTNGYDNSMRDIVSEEAFLKANSYRFYDSTNFEAPISIEINMKELNQKKIDDKVFVYFEYDSSVYDKNNNEVSGVRKIPVVAEVIEKEDGLYIEDIQEYETSNEVPKIYK